MVEWIKLLWRILVPPIDSSSEANQRWRTTIGTIIILLIFGFFAHMAWAANKMSPLFPGPPTQNQLVKVEKQLGQTTKILYAVQKSLLERDIGDTRERQCIAIRNSNVDAARLNSDNLQKFLSEYRDLTGYPFSRVAECSEIP